MREARANLWDYEESDSIIRCITTNGTVKRNGQLVMGRGCAKEAARKYPELPFLLGKHVKNTGNGAFFLPGIGILSFPVKRNWWDRADLELIRASAKYLRELAEAHPLHTFVLPRPGCGNGRRTWEEVRPILESVGLPDNVVVVYK